MYHELRKRGTSVPIVVEHERHVRELTAAAHCDSLENQERRDVCRLPFRGDRRTARQATLWVSSLTLRAWSTAWRAASFWVNRSRCSRSSSVTGAIARSV